MKKRNAIIATLVAVIMLAAVPFAYAAPGRHRGGHGFGGGMFLGPLMHLEEELDLTDAQLAQIKGIFAELRQLNEPYREQLHGGFHAIGKTLLSNPNDLSGAQALLDQQAAAEKAMKANMLTATSRALNVLTAEQRAELAQILEERSERRGKRGGRGRR